MNSPATWGLVLAVLALAVPPGLATEASREPNVDTAWNDVAAMPRWYSRLELANRLAAVAEDERDSLALLVAAKLRLSAGLAARTTPGEGDSEQPDRAMIWVARAEALAQDDPAVQRLATEIRSREVTRSREITRSRELRGVHGSGPSMFASTVAARATHSHTLPFRGGEPALVYLQGESGTGLELFVYDESGHLICSDAGPAGSAVCRWTPLQTGRFRIDVRNLGVQPNRYELATN